MFDVKKVAQALLENVRAMTEPALQALSARIDDLDRRFAALPPGPKGDKGDSGEPGKDTDPEMVRAEVARAVAEIPRPRDGKDAPPVDLAAIAEQAAALARPAMIEEVWKRVEAVTDEMTQPKDGKDGRDGRDGAPGKDGAPGRDAAELDILPSIDESKSYRRGTWASHRGGLWRAAWDTDPAQKNLHKAGWVCMFDGVDHISVIQDEKDPRKLVVVHARSSGIEGYTDVFVPMVIDRGVWREGEYEKGDHVSWDGSGWIAQRANTDKPGTSDAWRLSTKRGRDGKDAAPPPTAAGPVRIK